MALLEGVDFLNLLKGKLKLGKGRRETTMLVPFATVVIFVVYFFLFFKPACDGLGILFPQVRELDAQIKTAQVDIANEPVLAKQKASIQAKIDLYERNLPQKSEIPKLLEDFSEIAQETGVKIVGVRPLSVTRNEKDEEVKEKIYQEIPISILAKCGYHELGKFIEKLEFGTRFMKISDIAVTSDAQDRLRHNVKLEITTYTLEKEE